ncbi:TPA: hypothetical protein QDB43_000305 [Burkholderia vietnamiensis]|uniref:hypothetical protein n=1 Tax=Burkholderia pseudomallei TaxID=28450 RepID=UPI000F054625|nr:hypothetical protein [Burkholderia pseudomallei]MCW0163789.1 hypothetical protein [Burkholderia pseudomallei]VBG63346.1 Uncharacterised protein [Burkholderia pseudomallei]HDR9236620.1 hypothetical protein [Burkholderia vietnamiensis]
MSDMTSPQDFVLHPTRGLLNRTVPRLVTFGKPSRLPLGMLSTGAEAPARVRTALPTTEPEQAESTVLDFFAVMLLSHVVGLLAHCHLLGKALEVGIEANDGYRKGPGKAPVAAPTSNAAEFGPRPQAWLTRSSLSFGRR